ncbi:MAG: hypothetical protein AAGD12_18250 [Pseudomonadota bacterium]
MLPRRRTIGAGALLLAGLGAISGILLPPGTAQAQDACSIYTVVRGDTLREIAETAFGDGARFREIYTINRRVIGASPNRIEIGIELQLPCLDGSLPSNRPAATDTAVIQPPAPSEQAPSEQAPSEQAPPEPAPSEPAPPTAELAPVDDGTLRILTTGTTPPFADARQPGLGLFAELIVRALETGAPGQPFRIQLLPDEAAILAASQTSSALSFPWFRPDCGAVDLRSAITAQLCREFVFSGPIHSLDVALFVRPGSSLVAARSPIDFSGARVCVPRSYLGPAGQQTGLLPRSANLLDGRNMSTCTNALRDGTVDAVLANRDMIADAGLPLVATLATEAQIVIAALRRDTRAVSALSVLEDAIADLTEGAEWSSIVAAQIAVHRRRVGLGL